MSDNKAALHELYVILGTNGVWTSLGYSDVHVSPEVLKLLFDVVNKARVAVRKYNAVPAEGTFTDPTIAAARVAKEELKYTLEGLASTIWEEAKNHEQT